MEEPEDIEMEDTHEVEETKQEELPHKSTNELDEDDCQLQETKEIRAQRRKIILKELEVCDLLDLRNPQYVAEYSTCIYQNMK